MGVAPLHYLLTATSRLTTKRASSHGYNDHPLIKTYMLVICIAYILLLAGAQAYRTGQLAGLNWRLSILDIFVFMLTIICVAFASSVAILVSSLGITSLHQCQIAIRLCIGFYGAGKLTLYCFLLERAYIARAPFHSRLRDPIWIIGFLVTIGGMGSIIIYEFVAPISEMDPHDGLCRIRIQADAGYAVMVFDSFISLGLNGLFVWLLMPVLRSRSQTANSSAEEPSVMQNSPRFMRRCLTLTMGGPSSQRRRSVDVPFKESVKDMLRRNVIGSTVIMILTFVNNIVTLMVGAMRLSHLCLLGCLSDLTWSVLIIDWLWITSSPSAARNAHSATRTTEHRLSEQSSREHT